MIEVQIDTRGLAGLDKAIDKLDKVTRADAVWSSLEGSARRMENDYRVMAPQVFTKHVKTRRQTKTARTRFGVNIGTRHPLVALFEFGTNRRSTKGRGKYRAGAGRGAMRTYGFARRAFDMNVGLWFRDFGMRMWREVKRVSR